MSTPWKKVIEAANSGKRYPVMNLVRDEPAIAATVSKLVHDREKPTYGHDGNRTPRDPNIAEFRTISERTAQSVSDAQTAMQVLPEMGLAAQILISSILAPKDMMTTELTYSVAEGFMAADVAAAMIARLRQHFEQVYRIKPLLPQMLHDMLFETGSYPVAVIPENSIDEAINGPSRISMESLSHEIRADGMPRPLGLLGPVVNRAPSEERKSPGLTLESFQTYEFNNDWDGRVRFESALNKPVDDSFVTVTDNVNTLKIPRIYQRIREQRILDTVGGKALESINSRLSDREMASLVYKDRNFSYKPIAQLKTQEQLARHAVGNPLVLHLPSEAVIPVYVPGTVEQQIGYFVLLDMDGNPVRKPAGDDYYRELANRMNAGGNFASAMLSKVRNQIQGFNLGNPQHLDWTARMYGDMIEQDLLARLRNGLYGNGVALARQEEIYRLMLSRALAKQHTQLLFIPVELMTYMAMRFNEQGVGKSILDDMKIINSLRSMLVFANVMASLKNSIGRTEVKLKLDENDPNPQKTIEIAMHEIIRSRQQYFPLGMNSPTDLVDWLQRSGFEFTHEGHPGLPDVNVDFGQKSDNYVKPDTDLEENLRKRSLMAMGLNPETVDNGFHAEFATSVVANNLLLAKRVSQMQEKFEPLLNDHMHKAAMNSQELIDDLRKILDENFDKLKVEKKDEHRAEKKADQQRDGKELTSGEQELAKRHLIDQFLREFLTSFEVALPRPNSVTLDNQLEALKKYQEALEIALDAYVSEKFYSADVGGQTASYVSVVKEILRAYFTRQWMSENGMLTELSQITTADADGNPMMDFFKMQEEHLKGLTKSLSGFVKDLHKVTEKADKQLQDAGIQAGSGGGGGFGGGSDFGGGDTGGGGDAGGADGDFNMGGGSPMDDLGGGEGDEQTADASAQQPEAEQPAGDAQTPAKGEDAQQPEQQPERSLNADVDEEQPGEEKKS